MADLGAQSPANGSPRDGKPDSDLPGGPPRGGTGREDDRTASSASGRSWTLAGLLLAGLGLVMFPVGGLAGVVCGSIAYSRGERRLGAVTIVASIISFFASFYIAYLVLEG
jgi:hypothetical protein